MRLFLLLLLLAAPALAGQSAYLDGPQTVAQGDSFGITLWVGNGTGPLFNGYDAEVDYPNLCQFLRMKDLGEFVGPSGDYIQMAGCNGSGHESWNHVMLGNAGMQGPVRAVMLMFKANYAGTAVFDLDGSDCYGSYEDIRMVYSGYDVTVDSSAGCSVVIQGSQGCHPNCELEKPKATWATVKELFK